MGVRVQGAGPGDGAGPGWISRAGPEPGPCRLQPSGRQTQPRPLPGGPAPSPPGPAQRAPCRRGGAAALQHRAHCAGAVLCGAGRARPPGLRPFPYGERRGAGSQPRLRSRRPRASEASPPQAPAKVRLGDRKGWRRVLGKNNPP